MESSECVPPIAPNYLFGRNINVDTSGTAWNGNAVGLNVECPTVIPDHSKASSFCITVTLRVPTNTMISRSNLQNDCCHIHQILTVGHGFSYCSSNASDSQCTSSMYNLTAFPKTRSSYVEFTRMMLVVISDEVSIIKDWESSVDSASTNSLEMVVGGLSFGAPLAATTEALSSNESNSAIFTKHILMSLLFAISSSAVDDAATTVIILFFLSFYLHQIFCNIFGASSTQHDNEVIYYPI